MSICHILLSRLTIEEESTPRLTIEEESTPRLTIEEESTLSRLTIEEESTPDFTQNHHGCLVTSNGLPANDFL